MSSFCATKETKPALSRFHRADGRTSRKGFSLVEILTVLAIAAILTSVSITSFTRIQSAKIGDSIYLFSDYLKQAQTVAQASNSYVWIGFVQNGANLEVFAVQGTSGLSTDLANNLVRQVARPLILTGVVLDNSNTHFTLTQAPSGSTPLSSSQLGNFTFNVGGSNQTFTNVIGITPRGESYLAGPTTSLHWIQLGLASYPYNSSTGQMPNGQAPSNFGELFIGGLTGQVDVLRP